MRRFALLSVLFLASCQGGITVTGKLPEGASCTLTLTLTDHKRSLAKLPQSRKIEGAFKATFSVEPTNHKYAVTVQCGAKIAVTRQFEYPADANPTKPLELGALEL
jgi:hypothetical protein